MRERDDIHIRCPVHGTIPVTAREIKLIDHAAFQRLRGIKQLGFADLSFPGATHSRYSHSIGAMHVATRLFDRLLPTSSDLGAALPERVHARFRQALRLAMLFHDLGHAPLSHTTEMILPAVGELGLGKFAGLDVSRRATHEDYTLKIVLDSTLAQRIDELFGEDGIRPHDIAELILGSAWPDDSGRFRHAGVDYAPLLRQIVSSECDADRMDYLQRDSLYSGVNYGKFDADWLIDNVVAVQREQQVFLGIRSRAIFSFEDFLLSRYHMFATVYLHHTPVIFEKMLARYFEETREFSLPADVERYIQLDDMDLWYALRRSKHPWARRIVDRRPLMLLDESADAHEASEHPLDHTELTRRLREHGIETIITRSRSVLSKYYTMERKHQIYVLDGRGQISQLEQFSPLYARYAKPASVSRVFVDADKRNEARLVLSGMMQDAATPAVQGASSPPSEAGGPRDQRRH
jgi:uncharacterized protein